MPVRGLFVGVTDSKESGLIKVATDDLHRDGQAVLRKSAGDGESRQAGEVQGECATSYGGNVFDR